MGQDHCLRCGNCCRSNGMVPPFLDESYPEWIRAIHDALVAGCPHGLIPEHGQCVFIELDGRGCAIYADRPEVCKKFECWTAGKAKK